jgi:uncharacterized membrane protein YcaP (DUF421 family)
VPGEQDYSFTNAALVIITLVGIDIGLSLWRRRSRRVERLLDDTPLLLIVDGRPIPARMNKTRVDEADVMEAVRLRHGLERMDQIKYAVLETNGNISIVPKRPIS